MIHTTMDQYCFMLRWISSVTYYKGLIVYYADIVEKCVILKPTVDDASIRDNINSV